MGCAASAGTSVEPTQPDAPDSDSNAPRRRGGGSEAWRQQEIARLVADSRVREAVRLMEDIVSSDPANGRLHTQLGRLMKAAGMSGFMSELRLGTTTPHDHPVSPAERNADRVSRAVSCVVYATELAEGHDDVTEAFEMYHAAHRLDPANAQAYVGRARLVWELDGGSDADDTGEREVALRCALKCNGDNTIIASAHSQLANILLRKQQWKDAVRHAEKAFALDQLAAGAELLPDPTFASVLPEVALDEWAADAAAETAVAPQANDTNLCHWHSPEGELRDGNGLPSSGGAATCNSHGEPAAAMSGQQRRLAKIAEGQAAATAARLAGREAEATPGCGFGQGDARIAPPARTSEYPEDEERGAAKVGD
jgi:hypothetical protein